MSAAVIMDWAMQTGLAVSALIILVLLIRRPFAKAFGAKAAYGLWALPFIRLILPQITVPRLFPQAEKAVPVQPEWLYVADAVAATPKTDWLALMTPAILAIWGIGAVAFFLILWLKQSASVDNMLYESEAAPKSLQGNIERALRISGLKRQPSVRISDGRDGPLVTGLLRPVVILPHDFTQSLTPAQQNYALIHEFTHIRRGDLWVALAWLLFRSLNWPNPLVHYAMRHFRSDQEAACDASVLRAMGGGKTIISDYAETLVQAAIAATHGGASPQPSALALTIHHPLKERLMILGTQRKTSGWMSRSAAAALIIGAAAMTAPLTVASDHPDEELAGKHETHKSKSIMKIITNDNGKTESKHIEVTVNGDKVEAFEIDEDGNKIAIDPEDIEGFDANMMGGSNALAFKFDGNAMKFMDSDDAMEWIDKNHKGKMVIRKKLMDGDHDFEDFEVVMPPNAPFPPGVGKHRFLMKKGGGDFDVESFALKSRMSSAESKLEAAEKLIRQAEKQGTESSKIRKAKRQLDKARKALRDAEKALEDQ